MKKILIWLFIIAVANKHAAAQTATFTYPFSVGNNSCSGNTEEIHFFTYSPSTNSLANASGTAVATCVPTLKIGTSSFSFSSENASISFNPKDHKIYYFYTEYNDAKYCSGCSTSPKTFVWSWAAGTCPSSKLDTMRKFDADMLGVAFDDDGKGWSIESSGAAPYKALIRQMDLTTSPATIGSADTMIISGGAKIYDFGSGDIAISPSGQMFFVVNNKSFTPDYKNYGGVTHKINCTFIDTIKGLDAGADLVGLTYSDGELIAAYNNCKYREINPLTATNAAITQSGSRTTWDFASIISGIGAAKKLVSVTPTGTANQFDVVYDIYVQNYGNVDITNVQITDDLTAINGAANVTNISTVFVSNPAGLILNTAFDGNANKNLLNGTGTLPNFPTINNSVTIRVSCRLSNILTGVVYKNSATATAVGFNGQNLMDVSTNGSEPDLNGNDKPDDNGEAQPTPLLISVAAQTPPCSSLSQALFSENFGAGSTTTSLTGGGNTPGTTYTGSTTAPLAIDQYMITSNAQNGDASKWISLTDHTSGSGRMLLVNADNANNVFFRDTVNTLCPNQQYSLIFFAAFTGNSNYQTLCSGFGGFKYANILMQVRDAATGLVIAQIATGDISTNSWNQYGMKFIMPAGFSSVIIELINNGQGGCGNDLAIDDIQFGTCNASPVVLLSTPAGVCLGSNTTFTATVTNADAISGAIVYQWQVSSDSISWNNIASATGSTYAISSVANSDVNKYYRVIVAASGNMTNTTCQYFSPGYKLTAKAVSVVPTAILKNKTLVCPGDPVTLKVNGGTLGANANYYWYSGSCGGTLIGTGATIVVSPTVTSTYYVRIEGDCNITTCVSVTVTFNCDIDIDKDGITNTAESNGIDPISDDDFDGVENYRDPDFPGFVDTNNDGVNDNFDSDLDGKPNFLDRDSDNDGIPDVVEAGGVDTNGDGAIDNYTDTDNDGLSQNVDANNTGASGSGTGLGLPDLDGDGVPNYIDLDSDNDGIPDVIEVYGIDTNQDGKLDGFTDTNSNGFSDNAEGLAKGLLITGADINNDGRADSYPNKNMDADSRANPYDLDSDGDGITDVKEAGFTDADNNGKADGTLNAKGWNTAIASLSVLNLPNTDSTGRVNVYDIDSDDDGIPDNIEGQTTAGYLLPSGTDTDSDGIDNSYDNIVAFGGNGIPPLDTDGDTIPDYRDKDTDGDGVLDIYEGSDFNNNGATDDGVVLTGVDTDGDGLDDFFDLLNGSAKGTSPQMGNNGSFTGDATPGTKAIVQQNALKGCPAQRDWRCVFFVLNCTVTTFKATLQNEIVQLQWSAICDQEVDYFIVERSIDGGSSFKYLDEVKVGDWIDQSKTFYSTDNISSINSTTVYYRLKTVSKDTKISYSSTVLIAVGKNNKNGIGINPNPVTDQLKITVTTFIKQKLDLQIFNGSGSLILTTSTVVIPGINYMVLPHMENYPAGVYYLHAILNGDVITRKFEKLK